MAWPLLEVSARCYRLDSTPDVEAGVLFLYNHSDWEASTSTAVWVEDVGVCLKQACFEPLSKAAIVMLQALHLLSLSPLLLVWEWPEQRNYYAQIW